MANMASVFLSHRLRRRRRRRRRHSPFARFLPILPKLLFSRLPSLLMLPSKNVLRATLQLVVTLWSEKSGSSHILLRHRNIVSSFSLATNNSNHSESSVAADIRAAVTTRYNAAEAVGFRVWQKFLTLVFLVLATFAFLEALFKRMKRIRI